MIQFLVRVVDGVVVGLDGSGFKLSSSRIYSNKQALWEIREASPNWKALVVSLIAYMLESFPDEAWCIKVNLPNYVPTRD